MYSGRIIWTVIKSQSTAANLYRWRRLSSIAHLLPRHASTKALPTHKQKEIARTHEQKEIARTEKFELTRPVVQKWKRPPFAKNMFCSVFDTNLLDFPEILDPEHLAQIEECVKKVNDLYKEKVNSLKIDEDRQIPEDVLQDLKEMGLFGRMIPTAYGGLGLTYTEHSRLNEVIGLDWSIGLVLAGHELATQAILQVGSEEQKLKYLPDLASGKKVAALCSYESDSGYDACGIKTALRLVEDGSKFMLSGIKPWVTNGTGADLFVVVCKTPSDADGIGAIGLVLVDAYADGVKISECHDKVCLHGSKPAVVKFEGVAVPHENVLPVTHELGIIVLNKLLESYRFGISSLVIGVLKSLYDHTTEFTIFADRAGQALADAQLVRYRLSKVAERLYAMESVVYFTAAIYDSTENPDCFIESAIAKVFNTEGALYCLRELMTILGTLSLSKSHHLERFYRDAQGLASVEFPNDMVRILIGLTGCKYFGTDRHELVRKYRNPYYFPFELFKRMWNVSRVAYNRFSYDQDIAGNLHPSLVRQGNGLEECVQRLDHVTGATLTQHGVDVVDTQFDPVRLANIAIDLYVSSAVLSRGSRSYCIGLKNNSHELKLVQAICSQAEKRIMQLTEDILSGPVANGDHFQLRIGAELIDCRGYFPEHPLKYVY